MLTLGIDASTQSCSAIVIDCARGVIVAEHSINFGERLPGYGAPQGFIPDGADGAVHADPRMWLDALELLLTELGQQCDLSQITAISGAGQQHGSVYLNDRWFEAVSQLAEGQSLSEQLGGCFARPTSPIWMDHSTATECREINQAVGGDARVVEISGSVATERFTGPQIRRFYKHSPDAYNETARIHLVSSFLCSVLCGADAPLDTGDGAGMNLVDVSAWAWSEELLGATAPGLSTKLPKLVGGNTRAGRLSSYFTRKYGFTDGIPVTTFTGDNPSSLVGMGAAKPGRLVISLGTSDTIFAAMPGVVCDPNGYGHVFGNPTGGAMALQCFVNGSLARETIKDRFGYSWDAFSKALEQTEAGNDGRVMVPFFRPEISPRVALEKPILKGPQDFEDWREPEAAVRACVEGQMINMKLRSAWMELDTSEIYLTGGASRNPEIAQVIADVFQASVRRLEVSGSVALGAAIRAAHEALGLGLETLFVQFCQPESGGIAPKPERVAVYKMLEEAFSELL